MECKVIFKPYLDNITYNIFRYYLTKRIQQFKWFSVFTIDVTKSNISNKTFYQKIKIFLSRTCAKKWPDKFLVYGYHKHQRQFVKFDIHDSFKQINEDVFSNYKYFTIQLVPPVTGLRYLNIKYHPGLTETSLVLQKRLPADIVHAIINYLDFDAHYYCTRHNPCLVSNGLEMFLASGMFEFDSVYIMSMYAFRDLYFNFLRANGQDRPRWRPDHYSSTFSDFGLEVEYCDDGNFIRGLRKKIESH